MTQIAPPQAPRPSALAIYLGRMQGQPRTLVSARASGVVVSFCAAFVAIYLISIPSLYLGLPTSTRLFLIGSFGASAALLYAVPRAEFAQPRNIVLGQLISSIIGVTVYKLVGGRLAFACALAVAATTAIMQLAHCFHPPAGATALIAVLGPDKVHHLGYSFVLTPVMVGTLIILVVGLVVLNLSPDKNRHYPVSWW